MISLRSWQTVHTTCIWSMVFAIVLTSSVSCSSAARDDNRAEAIGATATAVKRTSARLVVERLRGSGLPIRDFEYQAGEGARDDYLEHVAFRDSRVSAVADRFDVDAGGTIDVFPSPSAADAQRTRVLGAPRRDGDAEERIFVFGDTVVRLSTRLSSAQAGDYEAALRELFGFGRQQSR